MTQLTSVVLKDRLGNDQTFRPLGIASGVATLVNSNGVPAADKTITVSVSKTANGRYKAQVKLVLPTVQDVVINGVSQPSVIRTAYADMSFSFSNLSNKNERQDIQALVHSLLEDWTVFNAAIVDLSAPY